MTKIYLNLLKFKRNRHLCLGENTLLWNEMSSLVLGEMGLTSSSTHLGEKKTKQGNKFSLLEADFVRGWGVGNGALVKFFKSLSIQVF